MKKKKVKQQLSLLHDLVNPLSSTILILEKMKAEGNFDLLPSLKENLSELEISLQKMIDNINLAKKLFVEESEVKYFSLNQAITKCLKLIAVKAKEQQIGICFIAQEQIRLYGDELKLIRVITSLLDNAVAAYKQVSMRSKSKAKRRIQVTVSLVANGVNISIQDWGGGIKKEDQALIFYPFFNAGKKTGPILSKANLFALIKKPGSYKSQRSGISLFICKNIIENDFEGSITFTSRWRHGTTFFIFLAR
ncbi:MAG: HAMP domain-containing sensor histidine kinase [Candidatus Woesebacteria bacterium]|jgi:signal transduction histidine kinase